MKRIAFTLLAFALAAGASALRAADAKTIRVLVWDEQQAEQKKAYGDKFLGETIAAHLSAQPGLSVKSVALQSPDQGLADATLDSTDVLVWWGHQKHGAVQPARVEAIVQRVRDGKLALIAIHSAHWSRPFVRAMQERFKDDAPKLIPDAERATAKIDFTKPINDKKPTPRVEKIDGVWRIAPPACSLGGWRADGASSHVKTLLPDHPIARGLPAAWDIPQTEMYNEAFQVPTPDAVVFEEKWDKGERFRTGCTWNVGKGRVFYFRPGHETYPVFKQAEPLRVIENAVRWAAGN